VRNLLGGLASSLAVSAALLAFAPAGEAAVISFDELGDVGLVGPAIEDQYSSLGVRFSSAGAERNVVTSQEAFNGTKPNFICTAAGSLDCTGETILEFSTPVNHLAFDALGVNNVGFDIAHIDVYQRGVLSSTVFVAGAAQGYDPLHIDLGAFRAVTKIRIYAISDGAGIGWDTFSFDVPEPALAWLLGVAALAVTVRARLRCDFPSCSQDCRSRQSQSARRTDRVGGRSSGGTHG
jgi:hypothetical protein